MTEKGDLDLDKSAKFSCLFLIEASDNFKSCFLSKKPPLEKVKVKLRFSAPSAGIAEIEQT